MAFTSQYFSTSRDPNTSASSTYASSTVATPRTRRPPKTRTRTGVTSLGIEYQEVICAISESRGISPTVGLSFVNLDTGEAILCQISDSQTYVRTIHKLIVLAPSVILMFSSAANPKSKLFAIIEDHLNDLQCDIMLFDRKHWAENTGLDYIDQFAFPPDIETIKTSITGKYFAVCCFAAVLKFIELSLELSIPLHSLRIRYEASEGAMLVSVSTIHALELIQNLQNHKSQDCLLGLLNNTLTPMGARLLRSNILQPLTDPDTLNIRYDALEELTTKEDLFYATRTALKPFIDVEKVLTFIIVVPQAMNPKYIERSINSVLSIKHFVKSVRPVYEALTGTTTSMLARIRDLCHADNVASVLDLIDAVIDPETEFAAKPVELRHQRIHAVKSGVNGLLDVARQTYKEASEDAFQHVQALAESHDLPLECKWDQARQFYIRFPADALDDRRLDSVFINVFRRKKMIECQTLDLKKLNQKTVDSHTEIMLMSDHTVQTLLAEIRGHVSALSKICESIALLDMMASFAHLVTAADNEYVRPTITSTLAIKDGRHPIKEKIQRTQFIPNDVYATDQKRFQVVTGCNMSGKSTYIRMVALLTVMAQIGSFVPASYASFPIIRQLFSRVSMDCNLEANMSTFSAEMQETAYILRNIDKDSMAIIDELGRGTSVRDGLAIALAIAEALTDSHALVWFATHFRDLAKIMAERNGVVNLHLAVDCRQEENTIAMLYRLAEGVVAEDHYGLKTAQILPFPPGVIEHATRVAEELETRIRARQRASLSVVHARRRKLILDLEEQLRQARDGTMNDEVLRSWLVELRRGFIVQMTAVDEQARQARAELTAQP